MFTKPKNMTILEQGVFDALEKIGYRSEEEKRVLCYCAAQPLPHPAHNVPVLQGNLEPVYPEGLSPQEALEKAKSLVKHDPSEDHPDLDGLLCKILESLGYSELVEFYESQEKWYE